MKNILIVDDQIVYLKSLEIALNNNYNITTATNFQDAIDNLGRKFDLALIDIRLDENDSTNIDGLKILEWIKNNELPIPVLIMSAYREFNYAEQALNLGAKYFFKKPIEISNLMKIIEEKI